jgi:alkylation response protein AidB-like acyl-CoA dehydrogenase
MAVDTPELASFRTELRSWLQDHRSMYVDFAFRPGDRDVGAWRAWSKALYDAGWVALTWPEEHGGRGLTPLHQAVFYEELARADAPGHINVIGLGMAGPTILVHGTEEQKERLVPPLLRADEIWCQGFSEPGSGSDLAGARTRAVLDGDHWIVNGQKVWSSFAHLADWCILVVRSDPEAGKHAGLSYLLLDMRSPGVDVRPLVQLTGDPEFNEIFLTDVRVPVSQTLGRPGEGWQVAMTTLGHERSSIGSMFTSGIHQILDRLIALAREEVDGRRPADDPALRARLAQAWIELRSLLALNERILADVARTGVPGPEASVVKLRCSEVNQRVTRLALDVLGQRAQIDDESGPGAGLWQYEQLRARGNTIEGGTSEILRGIVAERVLGLPRAR